MNKSRAIYGWRLSGKPPHRCDDPGKGKLRAHSEHASREAAYASMQDATASGWAQLRVTMFLDDVVETP